MTENKIQTQFRVFWIIEVVKKDMGCDGLREDQLDVAV
jgi:hypothetical protein